MRETSDYYLANGCKVVWLVFPTSKTIVIHRLNHPMQTLTAADTLTDDALLPGFTLALDYPFSDLD